MEITITTEEAKTIMAIVEDLRDIGYLEANRFIESMTLNGMDKLADRLSFLVGMEIMEGEQ